MQIQENIQTLINEGFNKDEIIEKLKNQGFSENEITNATEHMGTIPSLENLENEDPKASGVNWKSIIIGLIFTTLGITRLLGMRGGGGSLNLIMGIFLVCFGLFRFIQGTQGK